MEVLLNDSIPVKIWNEFLASNEYATPFQSYEFYRLFNSVENMSAYAIAVVDSACINALAVITLQKEPGFKGYFSRRAIIYGGPLILNSNQEALGILLTEILKITKKKSIYVEIRNLSDFSEHAGIFLQNGYKYVPYLNYRIDTTDFNRLVKSLSTSRLRQIKKAQKQKVGWKIADSIDEVKSFYSILEGLYREKIKKPLLPLDFFENFFKSDLGKFLVVTYNNKIIGGIMCPVSQSRAIYEFYICGLDNEYKEQYPSVMATWAAIEYANQNSIHFFDFMGAGRPDKEYGVRNFKARFGGELTEPGRYLKIHKTFLYEIGRQTLKIKKMLKF